jgi:hypothetical protein
LRLGLCCSCRGGGSSASGLPLRTLGRATPPAPTPRRG